MWHPFSPQPPCMVSLFTFKLHMPCAVHMCCIACLQSAFPLGLVVDKLQVCVSQVHPCSGINKYTPLAVCNMCASNADTSDAETRKLALGFMKCCADLG
jgi:hypothetical protein